MRRTPLFTALAFLTAVFIIPATALAQRRAPSSVYTAPPVKTVSAGDALASGAGATAHSIAASSLVLSAAVMGRTCMRRRPPVERAEHRAVQAHVSPERVLVPSRCWPGRRSRAWRAPACAMHPPWNPDCVLPIATAPAGAGHARDILRRSGPCPRHSSKTLARHSLELCSPSHCRKLRQHPLTSPRALIALRAVRRYPSGNAA